MSNAAKLFKDQQGLLPANSPVPNRRILVIDDEPAIAEGIKRILVPINANAAPRSSRQMKKDADVIPIKDGFEVVTVNNPAAAIAEVTQSLRDKRPFAMGFFDVVLGADMDGIQLVKHLFDLDPYMCAVFVTAYQDRTVDTIGSYLGPENCERWDYINKPFGEGEILQKARNTCSLWDLHRLKDWQSDRLSEAHRLLLDSEKVTAAAAVGRSVAHEFGNLLTHIIGNAEIALDQNNQPAMKNALDIILKASDTATNVLKRFRNMHGSHEVMPGFTPVDLQLVLAEAIELMDFQFRKNGVRVLRQEMAALTIEAQRNSLVQVLVNLFINSTHALKSNGEIHITLKPDGEHARIEIRDTGPGIPEELLPKVMEPFFSTKGSSGSGLGLSICREIIEIEHRGEFTIANHPNGGAQVTIRIPLKQED